MHRRTKRDSSSSYDGKMEHETQKLQLKRELGLVSAVSLITGTMIGSGIFMSPQWVLHYMGSPGASLLIWAACGVLSMLGALSYAELGTVIRESGGEYIYILRNVGTLPAFLMAYTSIIVLRPASIAAISIGFSEYVVAAFYQDCPLPQVAVKCTAAACILVLSIINCLNVRLSASLMNFFTAAKLIALLIITVGGMVFLAKGNTQVFQNAFENTAVGFGPVGVAFYQGLWSYDGWNNLNPVIEELKNPEPNILSMVHVKRLTPSPALILTSAISLIMIIPSDFSTIVNYTSFTTWLFYGTTIAGLIYMKIKKPDIPRPYKVPIIIPGIVLIAAIYLVLAPIIDSPQLEYLYVVLFILSGVIVYIPVVHYKWSPKCFRSITLYLQLLLEVSPAEKND
ncbi:b(0,+)-type amino acid transporter 1-like isoform X2 [Rana temporaria]|uniref:b(0,+)-type amino acid transporter 1-like isoform X2 n=1 Tax=Rana temporaria TaxID=8407 RepID=UPI001AAD35E0|nr:b(0,+)-type amino acid transporter 1-like isoform X2 [Rana temporaria]